VKRTFTFKLSNMLGTQRKTGELCSSPVTGQINTTRVYFGE